MLETLIITFREGVEIALIVGILLVYLRTNDKSELKKYVHFGLAASLVASVIVAIILEKLSLDYELFEGYLMFIAAAFVTTMIVWMWRTSRHIRNDIEQKVGGMVKEATSSWRLMLGVFLFTFLMVAREGIETVIFLRAASGGTVFSSGVLGAVLGIALSVAFGVFFVKGSIRVDVGRFLNVTAIVLLIFIAQLIVNGVHEFYELGVFPASPKMMGVVGPIVRNNLLFILAIVSIPAIMFIIPGKTSQKK
ncbi:MAG: FTR1 family protein, partial [Bacteroidota bacterium]